jgi:hypothetical protein
MRDGMFSNRLTVSCEHRSAPLSGGAADRPLEQGIETQGVAVVGGVVAAGDGQHSETQDPGERVDEQRWHSNHSNARLEGLNGLFQAARARARLS